MMESDETLLVGDETDLLLSEMDPVVLGEATRWQLGGFAVLYGLKTVLLVAMVVGR